MVPILLFAFLAWQGCSAVVSDGTAEGEPWGGMAGTSVTDVEVVQQADASATEGGNGGPPDSRGAGKVGGIAGTAGNFGGSGATTASVGGSAGLDGADDNGDLPPVGSVRGAVAVGAGGIRLLSRDGGKSWTKTAEVRQGGGDDQDLLRSIAYGKGLWVAGGWDKWWTSPDGADWTLRAHKFGIIQGLAYGNKMFIASTISGDMLRSSDGLTWMPLGNAGTGSHSRVVFGNGLFAASGDPGRTVTSSDGTKWQSSPVRDPVSFCDGAFKNHNDCFGTTYNAGFWVPGIWLRELGGFIQHSLDGKAWKNVYEPKTNGLDRIAVGWVPGQ